MCAAQDTPIEGWRSSPEYRSESVYISRTKFYEISNLLFERPNLNSTHLFRADIICDSSGILETISEKERAHYAHDTTNHETPASTAGPPSNDEIGNLNDATNKTSISLNVGDSFQTDVPSEYTLERKVVRRLIPRKPQIDQPLEQSCLVYTKPNTSSLGTLVLVVYLPHIKLAEQMPWYHPPVKSLAYLYQPCAEGGVVSVHYVLFEEQPDSIPDRLHRTFLSLLQTFVRLSKINDYQCTLTSDKQLPTSARSTAPSSIKDTILPQHIVQDTYTRLKQTYAADLVARWVESTEPSKHVFEDLSIAAFLIELWKVMYHEDEFPGFLDIACGNGVLVCILIKEGYAGRGFDARRRKTWDAWEIDDHLDEQFCIPRPFIDALDPDTIADTLPGIKIHDGILNDKTFIIANHADELTPWTPLLATLSNPEHPLPFLAIPCCSHALSGARHRYTLKELDIGLNNQTQSEPPVEDEQSASGDLKALREQKAKRAVHADDKSAYACLTKKTIKLAEELSLETEMTLMRIPSTRNIGIVGNRHQISDGDASKRSVVVTRIVERECRISGGVKAAAEIWVERARKHIEGKGRGKVNLGGKVGSQATQDDGLDAIHD